MDILSWIVPLGITLEFFYYLIFDVESELLFESCSGRILALN
jgi:hypothetical protein